MASELGQQKELIDKQIRDSRQNVQDTITALDDVSEATLELVNYRIALATQIEQIEVSANEVKEDREVIKRIRAQVVEDLKDMEVQKDRVHDIVATADKRLEALNGKADRIENLEAISDSLTAVNKRLFRSSATQTFVLRREQSSYPIQLPDVNADQEEAFDRLYKFSFSVDKISNKSFVNCTYQTPDGVETSVVIEVSAHRKGGSTEEQVYSVGATPFELVVEYVNDDFWGNDFMMLRLRAAEPEPKPKDTEQPVAGMPASSTSTLKRSKPMPIKG